MRKKEKNKTLYEKNKSLSEENGNLIKQNNYMRSLLSHFGILFSEDDKKIKNNAKNQQVFNPFLFQLMGFDYSTSNSLFNNMNNLTANQEQNAIPKMSSSPLQK